VPELLSVGIEARGEDDAALDEQLADLPRGGRGG